MHNLSITEWKHEHTFGQDEIQAGEKNTQIVISITVVMMLVEIVAGIVYGSMALLADGVHMGSHAVALGITVVAYVYARKYAKDNRFSFGTGKVNGLSGYTSAILLAVFAAWMAWESVNRLIRPVGISFNQALLVAVTGLVINMLCAWILSERHPHSHSEDLEHRHHDAAQTHEDQNLRAAYLHVLADALTSLLAIVALLSGKYFGWIWMDSLMGIIGAAMVARWSIGLIRDTSRILLDHQGPEKMRRMIVKAIESQDDNRICDLHFWSVGPGIFAASISLVTSYPKPPDEYKRLIPRDIGLVHTTVEVHLCNSMGV
jgi:cation diffusion facilitator family transporter